MSIGYKEWALVCEALGDGRQSILLRKGGIAEGRAGFEFKHQEFHLFPTLFHEQTAKLKLPPDQPLPSHEEGIVTVRLFARLEWTRLITEPAVVAQLTPFHIWGDEEIRSRFGYEQPGLKLAFARIFRLSEPWRFPDSPKFGGCRSWLALPDPPAGVSMTPVLSDSAHDERSAAIRKLVDSSP